MEITPPVLSNAIPILTQRYAASRYLIISGNFLNTFLQMTNLTPTLVLQPLGQKGFDAERRKPNYIFIDVQKRSTRLGKLLQTEEITFLQKFFAILYTPLPFMCICYKYKRYVNKANRTTDILHQLYLCASLYIHNIENISHIFCRSFLMSILNVIYKFIVK